MRKGKCPHCKRLIEIDDMGFVTHGPGKAGEFICRGSRNISAAQLVVAVDGASRAEIESPAADDRAATEL